MTSLQPLPTDHLGYGIHHGSPGKLEAVQPTSLHTDRAGSSFREQTVSSSEMCSLVLRQWEQLCRPRVSLLWHHEQGDIELRQPSVKAEQLGHLATTWGKLMWRDSTGNSGSGKARGLDSMSHSRT